MPVPNNLDQAEDDAHIPLHKNGPEGKIMLEDDDQDPNGQVLTFHCGNCKTLFTEQCSD